MPKNPVRAARQAGRQAVRVARTQRRQDERAIKTTDKVAKIAKRTADKVAKINASAPKRAASEPMEKLEPKGMTKIANPKLESIKSAPLQTAIGPSPIKATTPRSVTPAPAPKPKVKSAPKKSPSKTPAPKQPAAKKYSPAVELAIAKNNYENYRKQREQGTYVTLPQYRNAQQKTKVARDNAHKVVEELNKVQNKAAKTTTKKTTPAPKTSTPSFKYGIGGKPAEPRMRVPGMTDWNNMVDKYGKKKMGGAIKRKKC